MHTHVRCSPVVGVRRLRTCTKARVIRRAQLMRALAQTRTRTQSITHACATEIRQILCHRSLMTSNRPEHGWSNLDKHFRSNLNMRLLVQLPSAVAKHPWPAHTCILPLGLHHNPHCNENAKPNLN
eukprot:6183121-Pleurochrysis_carterae.AAC.2